MIFLSAIIILGEKPLTLWRFEMTGHKKVSNVITKRMMMVIFTICTYGCTNNQNDPYHSYLPEASVTSAQTVIFSAPSVGRDDMRFSIILPKNYNTSDKRYPVLYLLHGYGGDHLQWVGQSVPEYAARYDLIVVMPDSGNSSYVNWATSEEGWKNNWEDYIVKDVVGYVDSHYRTIAKRHARAINGLSMGGKGAITIGLRNPEMFYSIASSSGSLDRTNSYRKKLMNGEPASEIGPRPEWMVDFDIPSFGTYLERSPKGQIITSIEEADAIDPFKLMLELPENKRPDIYLDCGTSDFLYQHFKDFAKLLRDNDITHTSRISPGGHTSQYWAREVKYSMAHQYQVMSKALK
jgi:S-formylglutathione hydrolase FrmB